MIDSFIDSYNAQAKIALYTCWTAGHDVDTQMKGLVVLVWFHESFKISKKPQSLHAKFHQVASIRASAIHCCTPDTLFYRFRRSVLIMRIAPHNRLKLKVHMGKFFFLCNNNNIMGFVYRFVNFPF